MNYETIKEHIAKDIKLDILIEMGKGNFLVGINHYTSKKLKEFKEKKYITLPKEYTINGKECIYGYID